MGIYQQIYEIVHTYIYGGVTMTSDMTLVCTIMATIGAVVVFAIPICLLYKFIRWCF